MQELRYLTQSANLPIGLYFACVNFFLIDPNYLRIYWTDFHDFFHQMESILMNFIDPGLFSDSLMDVVMATTFGQNWRTDLQSTCGVPTWFRISQFRFAGSKWRYFC